MQFQLDWYAHCSALLLDEGLTLAAIDMDETDEKYASLVKTRIQWIQFCRKNVMTIADSKPVMMTVPLAIYSYLLEQVSAYQESLSPSSGSSQAECSDGDDVYYRIGGGTLCEMLKIRYKEIKKCPSTRRNFIVNRNNLAPGYKY